MVAGQKIEETEERGTVVKLAVGAVTLAVMLGTLSAKAQVLVPPVPAEEPVLYEPGSAYDQIHPEIYEPDYYVEDYVDPAAGLPGYSYAADVPYYEPDYDNDFHAGGFYDYDYRAATDVGYPNTGRYGVGYRSLDDYYDDNFYYGDYYEIEPEDAWYDDDSIMPW